MTTKPLEIRVRNLDCELDARATQRGLEGFPGLATLRVHPNAAKVSLTCAPDTTSVEAIWPAEPVAEPGGAQVRRLRPARLIGSRARDDRHPRGARKWLSAWRRHSDPLSRSMSTISSATSAVTALSKQQDDIAEFGEDIPEIGNWKWNPPGATV